MPTELYLKDAIRLAREMHRSLHFSTIPNEVSFVEKYSVDEDTGLLKPSLIKKLKNNYIAPVAILKAEVERRRGKDVKFLESERFRSLRGFAPSSKDVIPIILKRESTFCVRRFTALKELIHNYDYRYITRETTPKAVLNAIESALACSQPGIHSDVASLHVEAFCYFCALEILIPWGEKGCLRRQIAEFHAQKIPDLVIAELYRVPLAEVRRFFDPHGRYVDISRNINTQLDDEESNEVTP